jgi:hypothetical protein
MVFDTMNVGICGFSSSTFTYNGGYVVEGLSNYLNVTGDQSVFARSECVTYPYYTLVLGRTRALTEWLSTLA